MSRIRYRIFTERGNSRTPAPFDQGLKDSQHDGKSLGHADLTDRKPANERDEIAASVVLGYN